jgi:hypothetical protein
MQKQHNNNTTTTTQPEWHHNNNTTPQLAEPSLNIFIQINTRNHNNQKFYKLID